MARAMMTELVWRWDDKLGGAGFRVVLDSIVVGMIKPNLDGECWNAEPLRSAHDDEDSALPARGFRELESAHAYCEAHGIETDYYGLPKINEV